MEYDKDENGKTVLTSLGEQQIMQADVKYEPDLVLSMISPGRAVNGTVEHPKARVTKSRYVILKEGEVYEFTPALCEQIAEYLEEGTSPEEILEKQRQEYVEGIKNYLDAHKNAVPIWEVLKKDAGFEGTPLTEMPLEVLKPIFIKLTVD